MNYWGFELILDVYELNSRKITRKLISEYFVRLCKEMDMVRVGEPIFWDEENDKSTYPKHVRGITAIQLIRTSNITCHYMFSGNAYINIFSCKYFDKDKAALLTKNFFEAKKIKAVFLKRK